MPSGTTSVLIAQGRIALNLFGPDTKIEGTVGEDGPGARLGSVAGPVKCLKRWRLNMSDRPCRPYGRPAFGGISRNPSRLHPIVLSIYARI